jgi:zona occludens toxin
MFTCIDGLMGSGKSYYAVEKIKSKKNDYHKILTNIDSFKFQDNIYDLKFNEFLVVLGQCKIQYDFGKEDAFLQELLREKDLISDKPLLLVIDEAHNFLDKKNDLLTWFITYHRHLYIDVYLITQTYSLIHYSYHKLIQEYIHALPQDRQIFGGKFKYQKHISVPFNNASTLTSTEYLKVDKSIFDMYQSGDKIRSKSVIRKYIYYFIGLIFFAMISFYILIDYFFMPHNAEDSLLPKSNQPLPIVNDTVAANDDFKNLHLVELSCNKTRCTNADRAIQFDLDLLQFLINNSNSKIVLVKKKFKHSSQITILASEEFLNFFQGVSNEKNNSPIKLF